MNNIDEIVLRETRPFSVLRGKYSRISEAVAIAGISGTFAEEFSAK